MKTKQLLLAGLNERQTEAVLIAGGPTCVYSGAGTGKTTVITKRVAHLLFSGVRPEEVLVVTFTNKAARELRFRLGGLHSEAYRVCAATFHSVCLKWLRELHKELDLGFSRKFSVYDQDDALKVIRKVRDAVTPKVKVKNAEYQTFIDRAKNAGLEPDGDFTAFKGNIPERAIGVYKAYQDALVASDAMDFNDLIGYVVRLLTTNDGVRKSLQCRYSQILVDEYQDTNLMQNQLIKLLAEGHKNVFVVGDDDQSIYGWRGSEVENLLRFGELFAGTRTIKLEQNYRSSGNIVGAAASVICKNKVRAEKTLRTDNAEGDKIKVQSFLSSFGEAEFVAADIQRMAKRVAYDEVAVVYRKHDQVRQIEKELIKSGIPYRMHSGLGLFERAEIKDIMAIGEVIENPDSYAAADRLIRMMHDVTPAQVKAIDSRAETTGVSVWEAAKALVEEKHSVAAKLGVLFPAMEKIGDSVRQKPASFVDAVKKYFGLVGYIHSHYATVKDDDDEQEKEAASRMQNIEHLQEIYQKYFVENEEANLSDWLASIHLNEDDEADKTGKVVLLTLHAAKGLEWRSVYVIGACEPNFPEPRNRDNSRAYEEERRLMYVGMTRAKNFLTITGFQTSYANGHGRNGAMNDFVREISKEFIVKTR